MPAPARNCEAVEIRMPNRDNHDPKPSCCGGSRVGQARPYMKTAVVAGLFEPMTRLLTGVGTDDGVQRDEERPHAGHQPPGSFSRIGHVGILFVNCQPAVVGYCLQPCPITQSAAQQSVPPLGPLHMEAELCSKGYRTNPPRSTTICRIVVYVFRMTPPLNGGLCTRTRYA